jgi:heme/copper-type cytochrome/quinol oxidase subunit 2
MSRIQMVAFALLVYLIAVIIYEVVLRLEAKKYEKSIKGLTLFTLSWVMVPIANIFLLKPMSISKKLRLPLVLLIGANLILLLSLIMYQQSL